MSSQTRLAVPQEFVVVEVIVRHDDGRVETMHFPKVAASSLKSRTLYVDENELYLSSKQLPRGPEVKSVEFMFDPVKEDGKVYTYTVDTPTDDVVG